MSWQLSLLVQVGLNNRDLQIGFSIVIVIQATMMFHTLSGFELPK